MDLFDELRCGFHAFTDADRGRILDTNGMRMGDSDWENTLFNVSEVMSHPKPDKAIVDSGLKELSVGSGLQTIRGCRELEHVKGSDGHGVVKDPSRVLKANDFLLLVPGQCDPACNLHDGDVGFRNCKVENLGPVLACGTATDHLPDFFDGPRKSPRAGLPRDARVPVDLRNAPCWSFPNGTSR